MRVLVFTDVDGYGGHEVTLLDAIEGLCASKVEYAGVMYYDGNQALAARLKLLRSAFSKLHLIPIPYKTEAGELLKGLSPSAKVTDIAEMMKKSAPDVVIVSQPGIGVSICGLAAARKLNVTSISFIPSLTTACSRYGRSLPNLFYDVLLKRVYRLPDYFITIADHVRQELVESHGLKAENVAVIKYGVKPDSIKKVDKNEARRKLGWSSDYVVIMVGRIAFEEKGHDILIESVSRHRQELNNVKFYIVGSGPGEQRAKELVTTAGLQDKVCFVPWTDDLSLVYSAADVLVMPSRLEGAPLVMLEALAYGLTCIGSGIPGIKEILPDKYIFKRSDPDSLFEKLKWIRASDCADEIRFLGDEIAANRKVGIFRDKFAEVVTGIGENK